MGAERQRRRATPIALVVTVVILLAAAPQAQASEIALRSPAGVLKVRGATAELLAHGKRVRLWGALDARHPSRARPQVSFRKRYTHRRLGGTCRRAERRVALQVRVCRASDGTYWALQVWRRLARNFGGSLAAAAPELHVSRYTTAARFVDLRWSVRYRLPRLCGRYVYRGRGVHGFRSTRVGSPLDAYGRNVYLDIRLRRGRWVREMGFLAQAPDGRFCYLFRRALRPVPGGLVRLTAMGPGVTPIVRAVVRVPRG